MKFDKKGNESKWQRVLKESRVMLTHRLQAGLLAPKTLEYIAGTLHGMDWHDLQLSSLTGFLINIKLDIDFVSTTDIPLYERYILP